MTTETFAPAQKPVNELSGWDLNCAVLEEVFGEKVLHRDWPVRDGLGEERWWTYSPNTWPSDKAEFPLQLPVYIPSGYAAKPDDDDADVFYQVVPQFHELPEQYTAIWRKMSELGFAMDLHYRGAGLTYATFIKNVFASGSGRGTEGEAICRAALAALRNWRDTQTIVCPKSKE